MKPGSAGNVDTPLRDHLPSPSLQKAHVAFSSALNNLGKHKETSFTSETKAHGHRLSQILGHTYCPIHEPQVLAANLHGA